MSAGPLPLTESSRAPRTAQYAVAIFLSAFLLFAVEPMVAKMVLPWFGGSASVWAVCLLFFQAALLAGYTYAHLLRRASTARQPWIHAVVIAVSFASLPVIPAARWKPDPMAAPDLRILLVLAVTVGLPFFVLSSTAPLLQAWWVRDQRDRSPYRFYALSNVGSMVALLSYPTLIEPRVRTHVQAITWSAAYAITAALCAAIGFLAAPKTAAVEQQAAVTEVPSRLVRSLWVALPAVASALLLAITNHISQNVAAIPFLWIIPLSLYLLSFILSFDSPRWYPRSVFLRLLAVTLGGMAYVLSDRFDTAPLIVLVPLFCAFLFVCCMFCHGELARLKPHPKYLTSFYLMVALGGALGSLFVAIIAPHVFVGMTELPIAVAACAVLAVVAVARDPQGIFNAGSKRFHPVVLAIAAIAAAIVISLAVNTHENDAYTKFKGRNFYGMLRVYDKLASLPQQFPPDPANIFDAPDPRFRELVNGTINHGIQFQTPSMRRFATTYYSTNSGVGVALLQEGKRGPLRVGVIGLGAGTLAAYGRVGDMYRFYDINPLVINLAQHLFTFLRDSMATIDIVPGDARLSLEREPPQNFDVLAVDAFSGDSIPVHLLTRQAFELYFKHLRPGGVLAVHVSNRYLDLVPVVRGAAGVLHKKIVVIENAPDDDREIFDSTWVLVSDHDLPYQAELYKAGLVTVSKGRTVLWTDDYSSIWPLLKSAKSD